MLNDTSRAHMCARTTGDENRCGKLTKSMYGNWAAAHNWQSEVTRTMTDLVFKQGKASPCVFWHWQRDVKALVHGNDFVSCGEGTELEWLCKVLKEKFETKMTMVGGGDDLAKEAGVLSQTVRWHPRKGITYEADRRQSRYRSREAQDHLNNGCERNKTRSRGGEEARC